MKYSCLICKSLFDKSNFKRYCSHECYMKAPVKSSSAIVTNCLQCGELVLKYKSQMCKNTFCNCTCAGNFNGKNLSEKASQEINCSYCGNIFTRRKGLNVARKTKEQKLNFCSKQCKGTYDSTIPKGIHDPNSSFVKNRSALEIFIEEKIKSYFPYIALNLNNRSVLGLELDFYLPELNLAFEINGLVHYKAIYGEDMFIKIQEKDNRKIQLCNEKEIDLITVKSIVRFYESVGEKIWNEEIKPELLKRIPFCENKSENFNETKINPIKQLFETLEK